MTHQMIRGDMGALLFIYHLMTFYPFLIIHVAISQTNTNHDVQPIIMSTNLLSCGCWSCWIRLKNGVRLTGIVIYFWGYRIKINTSFDMSILGDLVGTDDEVLMMYAVRWCTLMVIGQHVSMIILEYVYIYIICVKHSHLYCCDRYVIQLWSKC